MPDSIDGSAHLDGLAQDAPDAPREQTRAAASPPHTAPMPPLTFTGVGLGVHVRTARIRERQESGVKYPVMQPRTPTHRHRWYIYRGALGMDPKMPYPGIWLCRICGKRNAPPLP